MRISTALSLFDQLESMHLEVEAIYSKYKDEIDEQFRKEGDNPEYSGFFMDHEWMYWDSHYSDIRFALDRFNREKGSEISDEIADTIDKLYCYIRPLLREMRRHHILKFRDREDYMFRPGMMRNRAKPMYEYHRSVLS